MFQTLIELTLHSLLELPICIVKAKLRTSTKKAVRNSYRATVLGGEIDGKVGEISAPKLRVTVLCALSFQLAVLGYATKGRSCPA